jgi:hypothetical protein
VFLGSIAKALSKYIIDSLYLPILLSSIPLLIIVTESLDAVLEIDNSNDKYDEYVSGEKAKLFSGIEKIIIIQNKVANIETGSRFLAA